MLKNFYLPIIAAVFVVSAYACHKKNNTPAPAPTQVYEAITGHVSVYDQYGSRLYTGLNNVQLTLKGGRAVYADTTGYYIFDSVTADNYSITASGYGIATTVVYNVQCVIDTFYQDIKLSLMPTFNLNTLTTHLYTGDTYDQIDITYPSDTRARACIIFVDSNVSVSNLPGYYLVSYVQTLNPNTTVSYIEIQAAALNGAGIFYGQRVYYAAYSYVVNDASIYDDPVTGQSVYNAVGIALTDTATCP